MRTGVLSAALAFLCWGLFPLYFHAVREVPSMQILAHRMLWSLAFFWWCWPCAGNGPG